MSTNLEMSREELDAAQDFAVRCENKAAAGWIIWLVRYVAILLERLRLMQLGHVQAPHPETSADAERLRALLQEEPEYDQHANMAGAAAAVIERQRDWIETVAAAFAYAGAPSADAIVRDIEGLYRERDETSAKLRVALSDSENARKVAIPQSRLATLLCTLGYGDKPATIDGAIDAVVDLRDRLTKPVSLGSSHTLRTVVDRAIEWIDGIHGALEPYTGPSSRFYLPVTLGIVAALVRQVAPERIRAAFVRHGSQVDYDAVVGEALRDLAAAPVPDAVPVLSIGDVTAWGVKVYHGGACYWPQVRIGPGIYNVTEYGDSGKQKWVRVQPLDGAPVVPTGEGLTISRVAPSDTAMADLLAALGTEADNPQNPIASAIDLIARLRHARAAAERHRLEISNKLLGHAAAWERITEEAELRGLLSPAVLRFALAMQERLDMLGVPPQRSVEERIEAYDRAGNWLRRTTRDTFHPARATNVRLEASKVALHALALAQTDGDLDTFDARAEIAKARGIDERASGRKEVANGGR